MAFPIFGVLLLALGGAYVLLGRPSGNPPAPGTRIIQGAVGNLALEVVQQTSSSVEWYVRNADDAVVGSGAGTYEQAPLGDMIAVAFGNESADAPVTLTFLAGGMTDPRAKTHGDVTLGAERKGDTWGWSLNDDAHDIVALGEMPSRGAALLKAEEAMGQHLGVALEGFGAPLPPPPAPLGVHGLRFDGCTVRVVDAAAWIAWAREQVRAAFDATDGMPTPDDLLDATVAKAMEHGGHGGCDIDELVLGTRGWADVEPQLADLLEAIGTDDYLSIPAPDEMMTAILVDAPLDNRGHKERLADWAIVVRPRDGAAPAEAFAWWAWKGARLLDSDAIVHGFGSTQDEAIALAKAAIAAQPAEAHAAVKE